MTLDQENLTRAILDLGLDQLVGTADLAWASFPCQDLSLAGQGAGLEGSRSGTFWTFINLMKGLKETLRNPRLIALENVCGALTSNFGKDFGIWSMDFNRLFIIFN